MEKKNDGIVCLHIYIYMDKEYYKSEHWRKLTKELLSDPDTVCELCGCRKWKKNGKSNRTFNIHHKHYNTLGHESREDLLILCRTDHMLCHKLLKRLSSPFILELQEVVKKYFKYGDQ